tara:strand:- start:273 stop:665 length:393 start_codon:yes stop_codon:yes gene_type:complete
MIRAALISLALVATPVAAKGGGKGCMGVSRTLCSFARAHGLKIISGYSGRERAVIRGTRRPSLHRYGRAMDVRRRRGMGRIIRSARRRGFGIGIYSGCMHHVHISIGKPEAGRVFHRHVRCHRTRYARRR